MSVQQALSNRQAAGCRRGERRCRLMLPAACLLILLFSAPLAAQHESNFGRVILANSDLIVDAVASATRTRVHSGFRVELTVQEVLHGESERRDLALFYTDEKLLKKDEAVRGLYALRRLSGGGFSLVGKPVFTPESQRSSDDKRRVCVEFIALEAQEAGDERTEAFFRMLTRHIRDGGYAAENAAVELMFVARDRGTVITEERFNNVVNARLEALRLISEQGRDDLKLAEQGMVEARIKGLKLRKARRAETDDERRTAADELLDLVKEYPRAFTDSDANLVQAMAADAEDSQLRARLTELERAIRAEIRIREAREGDSRAPQE
jgi:hypothetical protein